MHIQLKFAIFGNAQVISIVFLAKVIEEVKQHMYNV